MTIGTVIHYCEGGLILEFLCAEIKIEIILKKNITYYFKQMSSIFIRDRHFYSNYSLSFIIYLKSLFEVYLYIFII